MIENFLKNVTFNCVNCKQKSNCERVAQKRDEMYRVRSNPNSSTKVTVYCQNCDYPNEVSLDGDALQHFDFKGTANRFFK